MIGINRFRQARELLIEDKIILIDRTENIDTFKVKEYEVIVTNDRGISCTCENGSIWCFNKKNPLPCKHILAVLGSYMIKRAERIEDERAEMS